MNRESALGPWLACASERLAQCQPFLCNGNIHVALSEALVHIWGGRDESAFIRRELVLLLLEDPNFRLSISHAEACLQQRLPSLLMLTCSLAHSTNYDCWSSNSQHLKPFLQSVILSDPASCDLFTLVPACYPPKPSGVVHLNLQQLVQHAIACGQLSMATAAIVLPELLQLQAGTASTQLHNSRNGIMAPPPPPPPSDRRQPQRLAPDLLAALEATWPGVDADEHLSALCAYVLLFHGQRSGAAELPVRDLLVWLELLMPLDADLAHHPLLASTRQLLRVERPPPLAPALLDFLLKHPSSKGCFRAMNSHVICSRSNNNTIAAAAAAASFCADQGIVVELVAGRLAPPPPASKQRHHQGLESLGELLPAWERLRCAPAKVPFAGTHPALAGNPDDLPTFLFEFERGSCQHHPLTSPSPTPLTRRTTTGSATPAGLKASFAQGRHGKEGGVTANPEAAVAPLPLHCNSDPGGDLDQNDAAMHGDGIPCRRSPINFAGRISSNTNDKDNLTKGAAVGSPIHEGFAFGGHSFPGDYGHSSPLFPGSLMEVPSAEVPAEVASCWGGSGIGPSLAGGEKQSDIGIRTPGRDPSLPARHGPSPLHSPFGPPCTTDACMHPDPAVAAAAVAAGFAGEFVGSPLAQERLPGTLSDPAAPPWGLGGLSIGSYTSLPAHLHHQRDMHMNRRVSAAEESGCQMDLFSVRSADAMLGTSNFGSRNNRLSTTNHATTTKPYSSSFGNSGMTLPGTSFRIPPPPPPPLHAGHAAAAFGVDQTHTPSHPSASACKTHASAAEAGAAQPSSSLGSSFTTSVPRGRLGGFGLGGDILFRDSMESCSQHPSPSSASEHDSEQDTSGLSLGGHGSISRAAEAASSKALLGAAMHTKDSGATQLQQHGSRSMDFEHALEAVMHMGSPSSTQYSQSHGPGHQAPAAGCAGHKSFAAAARAGVGPGTHSSQQQGELENAMLAASCAGVSTTALAAASAAAAVNGRAVSGWAAVAAKKGALDGHGSELDPIYEPGEEQHVQSLDSAGSPVASPLTSSTVTGDTHPTQQPAHLGLGGVVLPGTGGPPHLSATPSKSPKSPSSMQSALQTQQQQQGLAASPSAASAAGARSESRMFARLSPKLRAEVHRLLGLVPGLKLEDFDDGVVYQLAAKNNEEEALGALRTLAENDVSGIQHLAAYINHVIKNYHAGCGLEGGTVTPSAAVRASSMPVSSKAILQKLPLKVYRRLEDIVNNCSYMEWKHFDAGVIKVMSQLSDIGEDDVFEELDLLEHTDLSNVEYMPAYLNKRLNNRLWSRRKGHPLH